MLLEKAKGSGLGQLGLSEEAASGLFGTRNLSGVGNSWVGGKKPITSPGPGVGGCSQESEISGERLSFRVVTDEEAQPLVLSCFSSLIKSGIYFFKVLNNLAVVTISSVSS